MSSKLVYTIEPASSSQLAQLDRHVRKRSPDGNSNIYPRYTQFNQLLLGECKPGPDIVRNSSVQASLEALYARGVRHPSRAAEKPFLRLVVGASPDYFGPRRDNPPADDPTWEAWDRSRLDPWVNATMKQLKAEHGEDLIFAELHLDETTPHIHAVVAPTYMKKPRVPGRRRSKGKRQETVEQFQARQAAARIAAQAAPGVRIVGRRSHSVLKQRNSFMGLRQRMAQAVAHLGIEYGQNRMPADPDRKSTRQHWKEQAHDHKQAAADLRAKTGQVEDERVTLKTQIAAIEKQIAEQQQAAADLQEREAQVSQLEERLAQKERRIRKALEADQADQASREAAALATVEWTPAGKDQFQQARKEALNAMLDADEGILTPARLKACWDQTFYDYDKPGERRRFCRDETQNNMIVRFLESLFQKARVMLGLDRIPTQGLDRTPATEPQPPTPWSD